MSRDQQQIMVYFPVKIEAKILLPYGSSYHAEWFDPVSNKTSNAAIDLTNRVVLAENPLEKDAILVLTGKE